MGCKFNPPLHKQRSHVLVLYTEHVEVPGVFVENGLRLNGKLVPKKGNLNGQIENIIITDIYSGLHSLKKVSESLRKLVYI